MADQPSAVTIAYVHSNEVAHSWHMSLLELIGYDMANSGRVIAGGWLAMRCGTDGLPAARNEAVLQFLNTTTAEWLFWIDTDMGFAPDTVERLLQAADPVERPIVGALCFAQREMAPDGNSGYRVKAAPTMYDWAKAGDKQGFLARQTYEPNTLTRCSGTGSAAILIHRSVFEQIRDAYGPVWYNRAPEPEKDAEGIQRMMGEDLSFCLRAGTLELPVYVHTGVKTTHLKSVWLSEADYLDQYLVTQIKDVDPDAGRDAVDDAIIAADPSKCPSCDGARWIKDENWSPEYPEEQRGRLNRNGDYIGLLACHRCNPDGAAVRETPVAV
ncbi:hypothetical protein [Kribbella sp. NPDC051718]|uniref:hypothetical protein n=1 Tax=Kribbella sp. NPDC051718 TaxID=3155168 RepID=UPI003439587F